MYSKKGIPYVNGRFFHASRLRHWQNRQSYHVLYVQVAQTKKQPTKMGCPGYFCLMGNSTFNVNWFSWVLISAVPPYFSAVS